MIKHKDTALDAILRRKVEGSLADPRPTVPAEQVFARLRAQYAGQVEEVKQAKPS